MRPACAEMPAAAPRARSRRAAPSLRITKGWAPGSANQPARNSSSRASHSPSIGKTPVWDEESSADVVAVDRANPFAVRVELASVAYRYGHCPARLPREFRSPGPQAPGLVLKRERSEPQPGSAPSCVRQPSAGRRTIGCELTISSRPGPGRQRRRPGRQRRRRSSGGVNRGSGGVDSGVTSGGGGVASGSGGITGSVDGLAGGVGSLVGSSSGVSSGFLRGLDGLFLLGAASEGQGGEGSSESDLRVH